jgi:hypothetical protein
MVSHLITSHHITSHHITSHHITSHHITSHHITSSIIFKLIIFLDLVYNGWGWRRDLTMECIEPNPGPSWDDIKKKLVEEKLGGHDRVNRFFSTQLNEFENALYAKYLNWGLFYEHSLIFSTFAIPTEKKVLAFLDGEEYKPAITNALGEHEADIRQFIREVISSLTGIHITSHHITSHHITSHHITSHITSHHITSHHTTPHHITLCTPLIILSSHIFAHLSFHPSFRFPHIFASTSFRLLILLS